MRKVVLNMQENEKYIIIKKLVETNGNKKRAALTLNCTVRHVNRMINGYKEKGKSKLFFNMFCIAFLPFVTLTPVNGNRPK